MVRRGGVEGHAPDPPGAAQTWNSAHQSAGDVETRRRVSASLGEMSCWVRLLTSLGLPASLSVPPHLPREARREAAQGGRQAFTVATGESVPG